MCHCITIAGQSSFANSGPAHPHFTPRPPRETLRPTRKDAFQSVMQDKLGAAIDARREVIAQQMMNGAEEEDFDLDVDLDD